MAGTEDAWPPLNPSLPDLSALDCFQVVPFVLQRAFPGGKPRTDDQTTVIHAIYVRLVDKAAAEYELGRACLERYAEVSREGKVVPMGALFRASSHFETCINSVHRAFRVLDRIRRDASSPELPRTPWELIRRTAASVEGLRNSIEHLDAVIADGAVVGGTFSIRTNALSLENAGGRVTYKELADGIQRMHDMTEVLRERPDTPTS